MLPMNSNLLDSLLRPFSSTKLQLKNRVVMAPMTRSFCPQGCPQADVAAYYARRASGGVGLIITEGSLIDEPAAGNDPRVPLFHGNALQGWEAVVKAVHAAGGKIAPQLWHVGILRKPGQGHFPDAPSLSPSGLLKPGKCVGLPMNQAQIDTTIAAYAQAARSAQSLGFDAVEIHGAHGYLIDQFFWQETNRRQDDYAGSLRNRSRFAAEIVAAIRREVGPQFPIIFRFSQWKQQDYDARLAGTAQELETMLAPLIEAGVDLFHCSTRRFWEPEFTGSALNLAGWTQKLTGLPAITVGSVGLDEEFIRSLGGAPATNVDILPLLQRLEADEFALVAIGRALIANPDWVQLLSQAKTGQLQAYRPDMLSSLN